MSRTGSNYESNWVESWSNSIESMVEQGRIMGRIGSKHTSFWSTKLNINRAPAAAQVKLL